MSEMEDVRVSTEQAERDRELLARVKEYMAEFDRETEAVGFIEAHDDNASPEEVAAVREIMRLMKPCTPSTWALFLACTERSLKKVHEQLNAIAEVADRVRCRWIEENGPSFDLEKPVEAALAELETSLCSLAMSRAESRPAESEDD